MKRTMILLTVFCVFIAKAQWSLTGNSGTNPGTNFIGTTDNKDLVFKTNNVESIRLKQNGNLYIGNMSYFGIYGLDMNYKFASAGTSAFYIDTNNPISFIIQDVSTNYNYLRISASDEYESAVFLQENDGKVVIGTAVLPYCASCTGYKLFVKDGIKTEKIKVEFANVNGWADYVFEKDYNLMPLNEVKKFIEANKHLPEVPTAQEVVDNGLELKEFSALLLKKVEELTLHIIKLNENMEEQRNRINELENKNN